MEVKISSSWNNKLGHEFDKTYFTDLTKKVESTYSNYDVWPKSENIFSAFEQCDFDDIKVVILGQDPYPTPGHAHGLCFSVQPDVKPFPKSLTNIFKEIKSDLNIDIPENGNLERWAKQGVFLLNAVLTVNAYDSNSHKDFGWTKFTDEVIRQISTHKSGCIFLLWGAYAQKKSELIDQRKHTILKSVHPSPLSVHRGFFGCKHFSKTNEILISQNQIPINW